MNLQTLKQHIERPDILEQITAGYEGAFSLGLGRDAATGQFKFILRIEAASSDAFPSAILVAGELVPVVVESDFQPPCLQAYPTTVGHG